MKKLIISISIIFMVSLAASIMTACTVNSRTNPPATVTVTITPAPAPSNTSPANTSPVTPGSTSSLPANTDANNNNHFFISREITGYTTPAVLSGEPKPSPVYKDNYLDLDLGGFFTNKDTYYQPRIPKITNHDDWFYVFDLPVYKLPWVINWGYTTKSNNPNTALSLAVYKKDDFTYVYNKSPNILTITQVGSDRGISDKGIHSWSCNDPGSFVVMISTNNADDIAGWWAKYGGQKFGQ